MPIDSVWAPLIFTSGKVVAQEMAPFIDTIIIRNSYRIFPLRQTMKVAPWSNWEESRFVVSE